MVHTVKIDDSTPRGKQFVKELRKCREGVGFENPVASGVIPEGYMTSEEFWKAVKKDLKQIYKENALL